MIHRGSQQPESSSANCREIRQVFLIRVHQLVVSGYGRMDPRAYAAAEEEAITGELVAGIEDELDQASELWMRLYNIHEEAPVRTRSKKGKRRPRVDLRIDSAERRPRTRFSFEAKRLRDTRSISAYLGDEGLGRFLQAKYAKHDDWGGMLGYVQGGSPADWAAAIGQGLDKAPRRDGVRGALSLSLWTLAKGAVPTYRSRHGRTGVGRDIEIYHTFFVFC